MSSNSFVPQTVARIGDRVPAILVVDDEELIRLTVSDHLEECGFVVHTASSGDEALSILEAQNVRFAGVVTDVVMPGSIDGFELAQWVQQYRPDLQVILTSGYSKKAKIAEELCPGVPFIPKPYRLNDIANKIHGLVNARMTK